jgi:carbamoyl-phosphate synthase large subunit
MINKVSVGRPHVVDAIKSGQIQLVINTSVGGETRRDGYYIRRNALKYKIPYATTLAGGMAFYTAIQALKQSELTVKALQEYVG